MILGREPGGGSCRVSQEGIGGVGGGQERTWASRRVGQLKRGAPDSAGAWEKGSQQGRVRGAGEGRLGGLGWSVSPSTFFFSSLFCCLPAPSITDDSSCDNLLLDF